MKSGKKPTKRQKVQIKSYGLNPENWLIYKNLDEELRLVHRYTNTTRVIPNL